MANAPVKEFRLRIPTVFRNVEVNGTSIRRRDVRDAEWRIELQGKEREILEAYAGAQAVKAIALPAVAAGTLYVGYKAARAAYGWTEDIVDKAKEARPAFEAGINAGVNASAAGPVVEFLRFIL